jgi:hypothetical protein
MSEAEASPVQRIKNDLERAQLAHAEACDAARRAADALAHAPDRVRQRARDQAHAAAELLDLQIAKLRRDLAAAEQQEREAERDKVIGERAARAKVTAALLERLEAVRTELEGTLHAVAWGVARTALPDTDLPFQTDLTSQLQITMVSGSLASVSNLEMLNGANLAALIRADGNAELIQFQA